MSRLRVSFFLLCFLFITPSLHAINDVYVVHFILDGLRYDVLTEMVQKEDLPNLKAYFDHGAVFDNALTTFPSVSSPGYISFATGLGASKSGIFFLEWFDRDKKQVVSYLTVGGHDRVNADLVNRLDPQETKVTLFEKLSPAPTAAIYSPFRRGATIGLPPKIPLAAVFNALIARDGLVLDEMAMHDLKRVFAKPLPKLPRYTLVGLYGTDYYGHANGYNSYELLATLKQFDFYLGKFIAQLEKRGIGDKTYLILSSDHGMHATGEAFEPRQVLWKKGIKDKSVYISDRGVSSTFLYATGADGWKSRPTLDRLRHFPSQKGPLDLVQILVDQEATEWLAVRDGNDKVRIFNQEGEGEITLVSKGNENTYSYTYKGKKDPLGYGKKATLSADGWFAATSKGVSPNGVVEIANLFQEPRVGDMLIVAKEPWSFRKEKAGTHGSLNQADMHIPLWILGPGVPQKHFAAAKGVDVSPTILKWFGFGPESYQHQEGKPLF